MQKRKRRTELIVDVPPSNGKRGQWHPQQFSFQKNNGRLLLDVPFTHMRELAMDIVRQGQHFEVQEPPDLRAAVKAELKQPLSQYSSEN